MRHGLVKFFGKALPGFRIEIVHLGAGSAMGEIPPLKEFPAECGLVYSCEADADTVKLDGASNIKTLPYAISDQDGERPLYICRSTGASSFYRPNTELLRRWHYRDRNLLEIHEIIETRNVKTRSIDSLVAEGVIAGIDFLRMNIQGGELDALRGGQTALDQAVAVQTELSFDQTYLDAPLFSDIEPLLRSNGFALFDLVAPHEISHSPLYSGGMANERYWRFPGGQLFESHCLFLKDLGRLDIETIDVIKMFKLAAIAEMYGQLSFALEILRSSARCSNAAEHNGLIDNASEEFVQRWQQYFANT